MRIATIFLLTFPITSLAFRVIDVIPAILIAGIFLFGVTELVNLVYEIKKEKTS
ncbi:hypothetical protein LCGC14_1493290 [marine sediment metagenome]|uniref:Uncharacterized protein n=1 Tax=marine sediment metagenome TaxID=412755 RepID=A0A0F9J6S0_9ZZZZ